MAVIMDEQPLQDGEISTDILIIGGGMSGLSAAIVASQAHVRCILVEKSKEIGGSSKLSAGMFWAPRDVETAHKTIPFGEPDLQAKMVSEHADAVRWMKENGVRTHA